VSAALSAPSENGYLESFRGGVPAGDGLAERAIRPVRLGSSGKVVFARVLFPQGVRWEQDAWFSGSSESVDTVTRFRFPDGIRWAERKADLQ
jgi:hypothetical protein